MSTSSVRLIGLLCLLQSLFVASTFRSWLPVGAAATLAAVVAFRRHRRARQEEPSWKFPSWLGVSLIVITVVCVIAGTALWRMGSQVGEEINPVALGTDAVAHSALFLSLLCWALRPARGHVSMLALGMIVVLLSVAAGGASRSLAAQTTVALAVCLVFTLASQIILGIARGTGGSIVARDPSGSGKSTWMGLVVSMLTLSLLMMVTSAIANATNLMLPSLQNSLQQQLKASLDAVVDQSRIAGTRYVRGSVLGSIRKQMLGNPYEIALRVSADVSPGYLRGHAFDLYRGRRWAGAADNLYHRRDPMAMFNHRIVQPTQAGTVNLQNGNGRSLQRFQLVESQSEKTVSLEIRNNALKGQMVFLPLTTHWVEAKSRELVVSCHGIVQLGVDVTQPYVAGVGSSGLREQLSPPQRSVLTQVPRSLAPEMQRLADDVCGSWPTTHAKAAAISRFFQGEFQYSMDRTKSPDEVDPILHFLRTRHPAHCEYFASASVLLLRSSGVPARYVTGYVADEYYDEDSVWVARNRDAHAWAEAYDEVSGQWFAVESTPGRAYQTVDPRSESQSSESVFDVFGIDDEDDGDNLTGRAWGWLMSVRATDPLLFLFRIAQLPLFCFLLLLLWIKYLRPAQGADPIDLQSRKMLRKVDRRLRKHALVRRPSETLYQFADRIDSRRQTSTSLGQEARQMLSDFATWYRAYADSRYQGQLPVPFA